MIDSNPEHRIRLVSQGFNTWRVQILFADHDLSASDITDRLREVKGELASHFGVPDRLLEYSRLLSKTATRNGLLVQIQITKQSVPAGRPVFRSLPELAEDGTVISDMRLEADLFPYDEFEQPLTCPTVEAHLRAEGFDPSCVDWPLVQTTIESAVDKCEPVRALTIGRGAFPGIGSSSQLIYAVPSGTGFQYPSAWMGVRRVARGEFLAGTTPAAAGHGWGRNVYGRQLEPRRGLQTKLVAGDGVRLTTRDTQAIAASDGLVIFQRVGRDKRDRDSRDLVPARLLVQVVPALEICELSDRDFGLAEPALIRATVPAGCRVSSCAPLCIEGDVEPGAHVECAATLRITGSVRQAALTVTRHVCVHGDVSESELRVELTAHVEGRIVDTRVHATDVVAAVVEGGTVEALRQTTIDRVVDAAGGPAAIRVNLRKFLEHQQSAGREALAELRDSLNQIVDIFGPEITLQVTEGTVQRMLLQWLRQRKASGAAGYTHAEMRELRTVLEMIPLLRQQLHAIGMELRDVTARLEKSGGEEEKTG